MVKTIIKRDGREVAFQSRKIADAISKAFKETYEIIMPGKTPQDMAEEIANSISTPSIGIEDVQNLVEKTLMNNGYTETAKAYILYRNERTRSRNMLTPYMQSMRDMHVQEAKDNNTLRENANVNGNTAMGRMLKAGSEGEKEYVMLYELPHEQAEAHKNGDIHIHDLDFYTMTTTCTQIDLTKLFKGGFSTGHGYLREPNSIQTAAALACIAIQSNQNDQHGGQSIPNFDRMLAPYVDKSLRKNLINNTATTIMLMCGLDYDEAVSKAKSLIDNISDIHLTNKDKFVKTIAEDFVNGVAQSENEATALAMTIVEKAENDTNKDTYQAMEALVHNLNTMNSRAGAQVPFSSINYGTDTSAEARMIVKNLLLTTEAGLGNGETPIFPIQIFRVKEGINYNEGEPNYDLFKLACRVSAKRLFPNFSFQDADFNLAYYDPDKPETEIAYMGCRTRVIGNVNGPEISYGRGNLSFTSINLPRLGIEANGDWDKFYELLDAKLKLVSQQLLTRFKVQVNHTKKNFPFLMGQNVWIDSEKLSETDDLRDVLKHGTLTIGFIGLAECLKAMMGVHHGESDEAQAKGLEIIGHMRDFTDKATENTHLNFSLIATPAEGLSGRFTRIDRKKYGKIPGVTDRDYYTNSMHVPVYYNISANDKIKKEAPYHKLCNGGHITYIELDGDPSQNLSAFEKVVRCMKESGIGYGAVNHPVDRDPVCGYSGIIGDTCPKCGRKEYYDVNGEKNHIGFDRIRRITGYLVGTLDKFNDGKRAEEADRVKHNVI